MITYEKIDDTQFKKIETVENENIYSLAELGARKQALLNSIIDLNNQIRNVNIEIAKVDDLVLEAAKLGIK